MIDSIIRQRRTIKPAQMNGKVIQDELIDVLLELANWAPTHGRTEPWRFIVYANEKARAFCEDHAKLYKNNTATDKYKDVTYEKLLHASDGASHVVVAYMKRGNNPNIPEIEEVVATSAAIQNLLLASEAHGVAVFWSTSGMVHHEILKDYLELRQEDIVLGFLFLGFTDDPAKEGKRLIPMSEKVKWIK
ncbi:MAG: nitroreductase [Chitinophagaceae bacterium]